MQLYSLNGRSKKRKKQANTKGKKFTKYMTLVTIVHNIYSPHWYLNCWHQKAMHYYYFIA